MCGIYGEFLFNGQIQIDSSLKRLGHLDHRGPDGFGFECGNFRTSSHALFHNPGPIRSGMSGLDGNANYFLGHKRLSINDLSVLAAQPMVSGDGNCSITFNGEIYNFIELRRELLAAGCSFRTDHSDTEALLNAYLLWGEKCLEKLNGMFAFAIYDRRDNSVFIARDRIGEKPLYYELNQDRFLFASELGPIISGTRRKLDKTALAGYLTFGYVLHPLTIYEGIKKLPPATCARIDLNSRTSTLRKYWDVSLTENSAMTPDEFVEAVTHALRSSISLRLRADVPVGAFISGGTDSTLVAKMINEAINGRTDVFGADFIGDANTERKFMEIAAGRYGHKLNLIAVDLAKATNVKEIISVFDEPFDGGSAIAVFELFNAVRKNYKVILTGDGGDELFAGYNRYANFSKKNDAVGWLRSIPGVKELMRALSRTGQVPGKMNRAAEFISSDTVTNYITSRYRFDLADLLRQGFDLDRFDCISEVRRTVEKQDMSVIKALQYLEMKTILPGRMLYKVDRFSMRYGVEARTPFLDHNLAELAFSIPASYNVTKKSSKAILKKILEQDFEDDFVYREKQGFGNPLDLWFRNHRTNNIFGILLDDKSLIYEYLDREGLHAAFPQVRGGYDGKSTNEIWRLIVLAHFLENNRDRVI